MLEDHLRCAEGTSLFFFSRARERVRASSSKATCPSQSLNHDSHERAVRRTGKTVATRTNTSKPLS